MKSSFQIPCGIDHLKDLRDFLGKVLNNLELGDIDRNALILAVDEVCANIIIHSNCTESEFIDMNVIYEDHMLLFEIIDHSAKPFDINSYNEPEIQEIIRSRKKGGVGLMLVKRIMDKIEVDKSKGRNICRLYKSLP